MMREVGRSIGKGVDGRCESARRAVTARGAVAVEAGAAAHSLGVRMRTTSGNRLSVTQPWE
eukprot:1964422-Prymnesium_polylepis.1